MSSRISAILGPTNTGKTYSAIEKLLNHENGVIGFPLRLLARENFEYAKSKLDSDSIALVTGEEKIIPENAKYFFCTVESIPDYEFDFVAIDEVQLAANFERGYLFTEKILEKKGIIETLFLGSMSMAEILKKIYPEIEIFQKPRLSKLSYSGYKNLARLPARSAVVAFSQIDVYEIANKIKQAHGGVSVVMGALSPDVRNAQVKLFEDGKVDHIVATDAIGLGLNLNIKNIFFSNIIKFDGVRERRLTFDEMSQIAGRAGRYLEDGFFGTTGNLKKLDNDSISFIEKYEYSKIKKIYWRNSSLNFRSINLFLNSLLLKSEKEYLLLKKNANDYRCFRILIRDKFIKDLISKESLIKKVWELCKTPDYSKDLDEFHSRFLKRIFKFLCKNKKIPSTLVEKELRAIKKKTVRIAELNYKISQIRKWSFLAFKKNWMEENNKFREKIKNIEIGLSNILHNQLTNEFIGEFKNNNLELKKNDISSIVSLDENNNIKFGKQRIGDLRGFRFNISPMFNKNNNIFNNKILKKYLIFFAEKEYENFLRSKISDVKFEINGSIFWKTKLIGKLVKNNDLIKPKLKIINDDYFEIYKRSISNHLNNLLSLLVSENLRFVSLLKKKNSSANLRAINYSLYENLGHCIKQNLNKYIRNLNSEEILELKKNNFSSGFYFYFFNSKGAKNIRQILINVFTGNKIEKFLEKKIYHVSKIEIMKSQKLEIYKKMGFYLIKAGKKYYLADFEYLEQILKKSEIIKRKKSKVFHPNNDLEKQIFKKKMKISLVM